jgi:hypothetical protein
MTSNGPPQTPANTATSRYSFTTSDNSGSSSNQTSGSRARAFPDNDNISPLVQRKQAPGHAINSGAKVVAKFADVDSKIMLLENEIKSLRRENSETKKELRTIMDKAKKLVEGCIRDSEAVMISNLELLEQRVGAGMHKRKRPDDDEHSMSGEEGDKEGVVTEEEMKAIVLSEEAACDNALLVSFYECESKKYVLTGRSGTHPIILPTPYGLLNPICTHSTILA